MATHTEWISKILDIYKAHVESYKGIKVDILKMLDEGIAKTSVHKKLMLPVKKYTKEEKKKINMEVCIHARIVNSNELYLPLFKNIRQIINLVVNNDDLSFKKTDKFNAKDVYYEDKIWFVLGDDWIDIKNADLHDKLWHRYNESKIEQVRNDLIMTFAAMDKELDEDEQKIDEQKTDDQKIDEQKTDQKTDENDDEQKEDEDEKTDEDDDEQKEDDDEQKEDDDEQKEDDDEQKEDEDE